MRVYVSGGISGIPHHRENFANAVGALIIRGWRGDDIVNPLTIKPCEDRACEPKVREGDPHSWGCYLKHDLIELLKCDAIAMIPGWEQSHGARLELQVASACGLQVTFLDEEELEWAK